MCANLSAKKTQPETKGGTVHRNREGLHICRRRARNKRKNQHPQVGRGLLSRDAVRWASFLRGRAQILSEPTFGKSFANGDAFFLLFCATFWPICFAIFLAQIIILNKPRWSLFPFPTLGNCALFQSTICTMGSSPSGAPPKQVQIVHSSNDVRHKLRNRVRDVMGFGNVNHVRDTRNAIGCFAKGCNILFLATGSKHSHQ